MGNEKLKKKIKINYERGEKLIIQLVAEMYTE
jgi:hypothetical protein